MEEEKKKMNIFKNWFSKKKEAFTEALQRGKTRDTFYRIAIANGGTGHLRKPLSEKEYLKRKKKRQTVKASRRRNRI